MMTLMSAFTFVFNDASSLMTIISFATFIGILWWTFGYKRSSDFDAVASLPFLDDDYDGKLIEQGSETHRG